MVSTVLASVLESYLGQYLELSGTTISVGSEVRLDNVALKESALSDLGLPVKCVHGKVQRLVIKIPWFHLFTSKTTIDLEGLHLLVVPSSSVLYNEEKEKKELLEAKQKRLERTEQARQLYADANSKDKKGSGDGDTFVEKLVANIIRNLEVTISRVHVRYEDKQTGSSGRYPFAAGVTLDSVVMTTTADMDEGSGGGSDGEKKLRLKLFDKHVELNSLALYWRPKANLYSEDENIKKDVIDLMFDTNIGTRDAPVAALKYLLGPISSSASLQWCPNPAKYGFQKPEVDLKIAMEELCLSLTKYQYQDFVALLQSFEFLSRAAKFRKYKARHKLENLANYSGRLRDLWKFAFDCVYEEDVTRRLNNWSWTHMKEHVSRCKKYRELYKKKLNTEKPGEQLKKQLRWHEDVLDEVNLRIQRQLAEREVEQEALERARQAKAKASTGWFGGWFGGGKAGGDAAGAGQDSSELGKNLLKISEALTVEEKSKLYEVLDYQENAHHGILPKSFVARKLHFKLDCLSITIRDDDLNNAAVLQLRLNSVKTNLAQRPSADYLCLDMTMESLSVVGLKGKGSSDPPSIVKTRPSAEGDDLVNFCFENNPPSDPNGDLEVDERSLYDQRLKFHSSPLEIVYDAATVKRLVKIFKTPDDLNLANLQHSAVNKLMEYREVTTLGLQYVIEHHQLVDVDIKLKSSYVILPLGGSMKSSSALAIANLGSITVGSRPITAETRNLREMSLSDLTQLFKANLRDQAYDKFNVTLENMQLIVALPGEDWRAHVDRDVSPLFLLKPTSLKVMAQYCLIKNDPEMPLVKVSGSLEDISVNVSDYRLIKLAQILDSLFDGDEEEDMDSSLKRADSEESMVSALSSLANTGSFIQSAVSPVFTEIAPAKKKSDEVDAEEKGPMVQVTKFVLDFKIGLINLSLTQQAPGSNADQKLFHFIVRRMEASAAVRTFDIVGKFKIGGVDCEHLLLKTPGGDPVKILKTKDGEGEPLLSIVYTDANRKSPEFVTVHKSVLKRVDAKLSSVRVICHQDAILDLAEKILKFVNEVSSKAKHLLGDASGGGSAAPSKPTSANVTHEAEGEDVPDPDAAAEVVLRRQQSGGVVQKKRLSRSLSVRTAANISRWAFRAKRRRESLEAERVEFKLVAVLEKVTVDFMTSRIFFAELIVKDLEASYIQTASQKVITAKLVDFKVNDPASDETLYGRLIESLDQKVFDAHVSIFDRKPEEKAADAQAVDVRVEARMGRVRAVFLMKFIQDLLAFLDPFTGAKEAVANRANQALEGATKSVIDAYANATRVLLDIRMEAPLIVIPVHSKSSTTFIADLGTLTLSNKFSLQDEGRVFDNLHLALENLQLGRARVHEDCDNNEVLASCPVIHPITFELDVRRNMGGAKKKDDPAELLVAGTLHEIRIELSKNDFDVVMAVLTNNFLEKGSFEKGKEEESVLNKPGLSLPVRPRSRRSTSMGSRTSLLSDQNLQAVLKVPERDPEAKGVEFTFKFRGLSLDLHSGETPLEKVADVRVPATALARIQIKLLSVSGNVLVNSSVTAKAYLENVLLEDSRLHSSSEHRITRLMEAKKSRRMIDVDYSRDPDGNQKVEVVIYSFVLVGSVPYLLEIANFFVQDQEVKYEWRKKEEEEDEATPPTPTKMSVFVEVQEPDIFLVENIEDEDTDALMLTTEVQFKFWSSQDDLSMMASLTNVRCHTCRFNPVHREQSLAQILQPCTLSFNVSRAQGHGMRVNANMSDLCLNVSPHGITILQRSVQAFIDSWSTAEGGAGRKGSVACDSHSGLWKPNNFKDEDFWFLKPEESEEAVENMMSVGSSVAVATEDEQAIVNINNLVVKLESGIGNNTLPLLLVESSFSCDVRNWSGPRMSAIGSMDLEVAYYNSKLALWEPVIEPVCQVRPDGSVLRKRWDLNITLQSNSSHDVGSAFASPSYDDVTDALLLPDNIPPAMVVALQSREILELTVTKTFIGVLGNLAESFAAIRQEVKSKALPTAPFVVRNHTGKDITVLLDNRGFKYYLAGEKPGERSQVTIPTDRSEVYLFLAKDRQHQNAAANAAAAVEYVSPLREQTEQAEAGMRLRVGGEKGAFEVPVSKADARFFPFPYRGDEMGDLHGLVSEVRVVDGCKRVTLRTVVQVKNHFDRTVNVFAYEGDGRDYRYVKLASLEPDDTFDVPIKHIYAPPYEFCFQVDGEGQNVGLETYCWRKLIEKKSHSIKVQCKNRYGGPDIFLNVDGARQDIFLEKTGKLSAVSYMIDIRPMVVIKNCLPVTLHYGFGDRPGDYHFMEAGKSAHLQGVRLEETVLMLKIFEFRNTDWECRQVLHNDPPPLMTWRFSSVGDSSETASGLKLDLEINSIMSHGTQVLSVFAPFWMVNKTGKMLTYRGQDPQNVIYHPADFEDIPMMFSYVAKSFMGKRKASLRIEDSAWSEPFTLDTIEDAGKVSCKRPGAGGAGSSKSKCGYAVGVNIAMSKSSLTKIITFTPYYILLNTAEFSVSVRELDGDTDGVVIPPGESVPFWPLAGATRMVASVTGTKQLTSPFSLSSAHSSLLSVGNQYGAIHVDCRKSNSETLLTLSSYSRGLAPVQLVNASSATIEYCEKGAPAKQLLLPHQSTYYTWIDPSGSRTFSWSIVGYKEEYVDRLISDGEGVIELDVGRYLAWVSFLDGMQRVLLFNEDPNLCYQLAHSTGEFERIMQEVEVSIHGIGISIVNNASADGYEVLYTSVTSSDIVWEVRRNGKTRYKPLTRSQCDALETDFQLYMREKSIGKRTSEHRLITGVAGSGKDLQVNYSESKISAPIEGRLRRQFQRGLWLQVRSSAHQRQVHAKINRIQIDNQMRACLFPVVMAPVPPPKSVLADSIPKPFIELSVLEYMSPERTDLRQYKYLHALVQELHIKVDQGLINALMDLVEEDEILDEDINEFLKEDLALARKPLKEIARLQVTKGKKDFYDYLHLSPLKVHVSFSLTSYKSAKQQHQALSSRRSDFFNLFLQSLGVTITDTDDIIFRLAYFERKHQFYSREDLIGDMTRHYTGQAFKQAYVLIFGLDVIGNPFGLVVGVSRSVEDLFYEPFQGAVEGPSEFAEGLVIGVRSVFSGVVGGAAGTFSRITGALGKGLASLTFDEKFQNKRREAIKKRGRQTIGESFARGGRGLVMGFVDGVAGVAVKPYEGAREEGVGGFFKGVGKGVAGLATRPTGGLVDFVSGTFDSVKRATEVTEATLRVRPARFIHPDGIVRTYNLAEATGNRILKEVEKGRYADSDVYVTHADIEADHKSIFLVTSKRVLFIVYSQVLGSWSVDWEFEFAAITGPPPTGKETTKGDGTELWYIIIKPKEDKRRVLGIFGGGESGKKLFVQSRECATKLARVIEDLRIHKT